MKNSPSFIALVIRLLTGRITQREQMELLDKKPMHQVLQQHWDVSGEPSSNTVADRQLSGSSVGERIYRRISRRIDAPQPVRHPALSRWQGYAAAAVVGLIISCTGYLTWTHLFHTAASFCEYTATSEMKYVLPDSSVVWMKPGSTIRYAKHFTDNRDVQLTGSSLFDVKKQAGHPFRVLIDRACIEVKGTVFQVQRTDAGTYDIALLRGKIELSVHGQDKPVELNPLQTANYHPDSGKTLLSPLPEVIWEDGRFAFKEIPLNRLVRTVNQLFGIRILLDSRINSNTLFTGSIRSDESIEEITTKLCFTLNLTREQIDRSTVVLRE
jgi:ferric-dicitrate binding protein FerR (iron transport regulator)